MATAITKQALGDSNNKVVEAPSPVLPTAAAAATPRKRQRVSTSPVKKQNQPNLREIVEIARTPESTFQYLQEKGVFPRKDFKFNCVHCNSNRVNMKGFCAKKGQRRSPRCRCNACNKEWSIYRGSFFEKKRLPLDLMLIVAYLWILKINVEQIVAFFPSKELSVTTVTDYFACLHQLVTNAHSGSETTLEAKGSRKHQANFGHAGSTSWRRSNEGDLWSALLKAFATVGYNDGLGWYQVPSEDDKVAIGSSIMGEQTLLQLDPKNPGEDKLQNTLTEHIQNGGQAINGQKAMVEHVQNNNQFVNEQDKMQGIIVEGHGTGHDESRMNMPAGDLSGVC
mmetsp:Transcript_24191/g.37306  ORF Transcript_24191/g.37306 Transcript_24191/m.37306 type:complete len:338 (+) Transcript_24191:205-1218(+)|eukprot:CAMPEP_0196814288 /NCGR_PEP_ID=MMETSP1362-20130617/42454_1 /TAXON_ID=163516 /ORGANISM="Leptocylindrus danicus, Strain CCMP1856" /LENGTH=337 /DNA_ID=CAMNT_0042190855 /DNA_START=197 /DNA_END=1210 /DNA_ORIENTATION=-